MQVSFAGEISEEARARTVDFTVGMRLPQVSQMTPYPTKSCPDQLEISTGLFRAMAQPIPDVLAHLVQLNVDFQVLVCLEDKCRCAVSPRAIVRHFHDQHRTPIELRKVIERYIKSFPGSYDYLSVHLPPDRSYPQPIIEVVDGFRCQRCQFMSRNRRVTRQHANKEHGLKGEEDTEIFSIVRIQSWFKGERAQYWVVDEAGDSGLYNPHLRSMLIKGRVRVKATTRSRTRRYRACSH